MRLGSISNTLVEAFDRATDAQRRQAVWAACSAAISHACLEGPVVDAAFGILRQGGTGQMIRRGLETLCKRHDDRYLELHEEADESTKAEALDTFQKARAAAALAFALTADAEEQLEALYEAITSMANEAAAIQLVETALRIP